MNILVLGKKGSMTNWVEEALDGFTASGHDVRFCATRVACLHKRLEQPFRPFLVGWLKRQIAKLPPIWS